MLSSWLTQKQGGEEENLESTPRPSFSSPTEATHVNRPSTDKPPKRAFPTAYTTPHDAVLTKLQGNIYKTGVTDIPAGPASVKDSQIGSPSTEPTSPTLQQHHSRITSSDVLVDPFDGSSLGVLIPHGQGTSIHGDSQSPSQINLLSGHEGVINSNPTGSEAIWSHLSRVLDIQSEISKMHLNMETIGQGKPGDWKGKHRRPSHKGASENQANSSALSPDDPPVPPGLRLPRQRAMSTVSTISSAEEGDEEGVNIADEEEEKSRIRGEEFARLASQFEGRKEAINEIMGKLDDLSKTLSDFHTLQTPDIAFSSSRNNSVGVASPSATSLSVEEDPKIQRTGQFRTSAPTGDRTFEWAQQNLAPSFLAAHSAPSLNRAISDTTAMGVSTLKTIPQRKNLPILLVNSVDPGRQSHIMDSPASTIGSLKLPPEE